MGDSRGVGHVRGVTYKKDQSRDTSADGFVPLLRANNIQREINFDGLVYVPSEVVTENQMLTVGDHLICMSSGSKNLVGKSAVVTETTEATFGAFCSVFRPNAPQLVPILPIFFGSPLYRNAISDASRGMGINNLRKGDIASLVIPVPPLGEQRRIVAKVDELIALCDGLDARLVERDRLGEALAASVVDAFAA